MQTNNNINGVLFRQNANNSSSFVVNIPSKTNNVLVFINSLTSTVADGSEFLIIQTAPSSGVFATSGYVTSTKFSPSTNNSWSNQSIGTGLMISANYNASLESYQGCTWLTNLNTAQAATSVGTLSVNSPSDALTPSYFIANTGVSPTTFTSMIRIQLVLGSMSGLVTVYSLI